MSGTRLLAIGDDVRLICGFLSRDPKALTGDEPRETEWTGRLGYVLGDCRRAGRRGEVADTPPNRMDSVGYNARVFRLGAAGG